MGPYWMWTLLAACYVVVNAEDDKQNANIEIDLKKYTKNIATLVDELAKQTNVPFRCDEKVLNDTLPLVTFGRVYDYYEKLLDLSKFIQKLEKDEGKKSPQMDEWVNSRKRLRDHIVRSSDQYIRELTHILSGKQDELDKLFDVLNNEDKLRNVQSKLPPLTREHTNRWEQLKKLKKNVEALKKQNAYGNISHKGKVEKYLMEYEKAKKLTSCKEYIAKAIRVIECDRSAMKIFATSMSTPTLRGMQPLNLGQLKKKLQGKIMGQAGILLSYIHAIKHLRDFRVADLDNYGPEQDNMTAFDALKRLIREKINQRRSDIIAKIISRIDAIRQEADRKQ